MSTTNSNNMTSMKKKIITTIITMLAIVSMAQAGTSYGFSVGGVAITSDNYQSITTNVTSGYVSFDPQTATLTLNNAVIDTRPLVMTDNNQRSAITFSPSHFKRFKVKLIGSNSLLGCPRALALNNGVTVVIDGPGSMQVMACILGNMGMTSPYSIYLGFNSNLQLRNVGWFDIFSLNANSGSSLTVIYSAGHFLQNPSGLSEMYLIGTRFTNPGVVFEGGYFMDGNGNVLSDATVVRDIRFDFNKDNALNDTDIDAWVDNKLGFATIPVNMDDYDVNSDGNLSVTDVLLFRSYKDNIIGIPWRNFFMLKYLEADQNFLAGVDHPFMYSNHTTETWALVDIFELPNGVLDDADASHFSCWSSNYDVAEASVVPITVWDNLPSYGFRVTAKKSGTAIITVYYNDNNGNKLNWQVPVSFYTQSERLASNDKLYAAKIIDDEIWDLPLEHQMTVPVGTTMKLTIDRDAVDRYGINTRKSRIACTTWEVSGNDKVTLTKTDNGYVEVEVGGAGQFTITAKHAGNNQRSATFKARDVYTISERTVFKNREVFFSTPAAKTSPNMGKASVVRIKKMITHNGKVWTAVNHYKNCRSSPVGNRSWDNYQAPVYAQVFCNNELFYEMVDSYVEDITVCERVGENSKVIIVGKRYDPNIEFGEESSASSGIDCSLRLSAFYVAIDEITYARKEAFNPLGHNYESCINKVVCDHSSGNDICFLGTATRKHTEYELFWSGTCYPQDWFFIRYDYSFNIIKEAQKRKDNGSWTYQVKDMTMAKNKIVGVIDRCHYSPVWGYGMWTDDGESDYRLFYDFYDYEDGGSVSLNETLTNGEHTRYDFGNASSSSDGRPLYFTYSKEPYVYRCDDDFLYHESVYNNSDIKSFIQIKMIYNSSAVNDPDELFILARMKDGKMTLISDLGEIRYGDKNLYGFDVMDQ